MLIRSISGVRGLSKSYLTPEISISYAKALHKYLPEGVIMSGRDSRPSGELLIDTMNQELARLGRTVIDCGIVPTPTVQFMVHNTEAVGGYIVTASHNPIEWNGLKFLRSDSTFFHAEDCEKLFRIVDANKDLEDSRNPGMIWQEKNAIQKHIISCVSIECIDLNRILHAGQNYRYHHLIYAGDTITMESQIIDIYAKKNRTLQFLEFKSLYTNQNNQLVSESNSTLVARF